MYGVLVVAIQQLPPAGLPRDNWGRQLGSRGGRGGRRLGTAGVLGRSKGPAAGLGVHPVTHACHQRVGGGGQVEEPERR